MSLPIDGSADHEISVKGLPNLEIGDWTREPLQEPVTNRRGRGPKNRNQRKDLGRENSGPENSRRENLGRENSGRENEDFEMSTTGDEDDRIQYVEKDGVL